MARKQTTRLQRSGFRFLNKRQEQAFLTGDARGLGNGNPFAPQTSAVTVGFAFLAFLMVVGLLVSVLKPKPDRGVDKIITSQSGGMYVMYADTLHPVTNLASARLIVGAPDNATVAKDSTLEKFPRGPLMGIPSAPNSMASHSDDPATWVLCDRRDSKASISLTTVGGLTTTIMAGRDIVDPNAPVMNSDQALLVRSKTAPDTVWLVYNGHRAEIGREDFATQAALGLTPAKMNSAFMLSGGLIDALDVYPSLTIPYIDNRGKVSSIVQEYVIGDVLTIGNDKGQNDDYLVLNDGVQRITPLVASLLINTGSRHFKESDPEKVTTLPSTQSVDLNRYPSHIPDILDPTTVCLSWARGRSDAAATIKIITSDALPVADEYKDDVIQLLRPAAGNVQADATVMQPGKGWYVRITGSSASSLSAEQLMYIDDTGTRYFISPDDKGSYDPIVGALGLNWQLPMPIPWSIAKMYVQGSTLSKDAALVQHAFIPPNLHGVPAPAHPGDVSAPPGEN